MIGLVLVTHGQLAAEFRHAVEHVVGPQDNFETVAIGADDDMEQRRRDIVDAVGRVDTGTGVIVLTDMFGGTPSNLAISVMESGRTEVIAGMNLRRGPVLIAPLTEPAQLAAIGKLARTLARTGARTRRRPLVSGKPGPGKIRGRRPHASKSTRVRARH